MKLPPFDYACPTTLPEAIELLASHDGDAKAIAGGQSLVPMLAFRLAQPTLLVDLRKLADLRGSQWRGALWHRVRAKDCDLTELDLTGAQLLRCELGPVRMARMVNWPSRITVAANAAVQAASAASSGGLKARLTKCMCAFCLAAIGLTSPARVAMGGDTNPKR